MTTTVIVHIAPDADGKRCGECDPKNLGYCRTFRRWCAPDGNTRLPECHRREKLLADLVEAGEAMREQDAMRGTAQNRWDAAIDAIKEETS